MKETQRIVNGIPIKIVRKPATGLVSSIKKEEIAYYLELMQDEHPGREIASLTIVVKRGDEIELDVELVPTTHKRLQRPSRFR